MTMDYVTSSITCKVTIRVIRHTVKVCSHGARQILAHSTPLRY